MPKAVWRLTAQEMVNQIIGRIREFGVTVAPERLQKVIYNCSLPLCEIVEEDRQQLAEILENSGNIEFLQQKYRNEVLAPEELRLQIFRQKIKENWEMPLSLADRELLPSQGSAVPRPVVDTGEFPNAGNSAATARCRPKKSFG